MPGLQRLRLCAVILLLLQVICVVCRPEFAETKAAAEIVQTGSFHVEVDPIIQKNEITIDETALHVEVIKQEPSWSGKRVLIYHTHTYEAYEQVEGKTYKQIEKWRTEDSSYNVIAVGTALTASLRALGIEVVHDITAFEPPTIDDAYNRSLMMLEKRQSNGEQYDLYIDLHRDAVASTSTIRRTVNIGGENAARFMVLIGKGTSGGYVEKPDWEANLVIAEKMTEALNRQCDGLARDVKVKTGRYNQHIAVGSILIECGMNSNTLDEVLTGIPYLANAIAEVLSNHTE